MNRAFLVLAVTVLLPIWSDPSNALKEDRAWLITPEEAALDPSTDQDIQARGLSDDGPRIEIVKPKQGELVPSPAEILIQFVPRRVTIDLTSLKVTQLKFISIDLTERLKPYISMQGISVKDAKVPAGTYRVRISLSDESGTTTTKEISFVIQ